MSTYKDVCFYNTYEMEFYISLNQFNELNDFMLSLTCTELKNSKNKHVILVKLMIEKFSFNFFFH